MNSEPRLRFGFPGWRSRSLFLCFVGIFLLSLCQAFAHRPYERAAGTFQRADGISIAIVRHYVDGILMGDPVSIRFRLPDGAEIARTPHRADAIVRPVAAGVEIYQFELWIPLARRVDLFDGYTLKNITATRRWHSLVVHFTEHWGRYLGFAGAGVFLLLFCVGLWALPRRRWIRPLQWIGSAFVYLVVFLFFYDLLFLEPVSPLVFIGGGVILAALYLYLQRKK